ncbi:transposon Tf2-11 polyprotein [Trichonephila clavipes]|nr:transposon Tf2-11 polyprotein [Trichonephila clavipes]
MVRKKKRAKNPRKNIALTAKEIESSSSPNKISENHTSKMEAKNENKIKQEENFDADEENLEIPIQKFIRNFESTCDSFDIPEKQKILFIIKLVDGAVKTYIKSQSIPKRFYELKNNLIREFGKRVNPAEIHLQLSKTEKTSKETHIEYFYRIKEIASRINMEEAEKFYIIKGLKENRSIELQLRSCNNIEELKEKMKLLDIQEKSKSNGNAIIYPKYPVTRIPHHTNQFVRRQLYGGWNWRNDQSQHPDAITGSRYNVYSPQFLSPSYHHPSFSLQRPTLYPRNQRFPQRPTVLQPNAPTFNPRQRTQNNNTVFQPHQTGELMIIQGRINFKQVDLLLDTGSSVNIIPKNIISQIKGYYKVEYIKTKIATINGEIENQNWNWTPECQQSFQKLKDSLISKPILAIFNPNYPCHLYVDASKTAISCILKQHKRNGNQHPIAFHSRRLRNYEINYTITELECLAIIDSLDKFHCYLHGSHFTVHTDHNALVWLKNFKNPTGRLFRWSLKVSMYDFDIKYKKGSTNVEADMLTRNPIAYHIINTTPELLLDINEISHFQNIENTSAPKCFKRDGVFVVKRQGLTKIIVPKALRVKLMETTHKKFGHPGVATMLKLISPQYYWINIITDIRNYVKHCETCQINKKSHQRKYGLMQSLALCEKPFELLSIDSVGGLNYYNSVKNIYTLLLIMQLGTFGLSHQKMQQQIPI